MNDAHASWMRLRRPTYAAGIGLSLLAQGLLLSLWQLAQPQRHEDGTPSSSMILGRRSGINFENQRRVSSSGASSVGMIETFLPLARWST